MEEASSAEPVLRVERSEDLLALTLNQPKQGNALSPALVEALIETLEAAERVRLCVLRGEGRHFCTGFDLSDLEALSDGDLLWRFLRIETLLQTVHHAPFPVAAFAQGQVVGAGADLFAACWQRIATPDAKFRMPGWNFELALGTRRLTRLVGQDAARDLLIDTKVLSAEGALSCSLATGLADPSAWQGMIDDLLERASVLPADALVALFQVTSTDTRDADLAAVVRTAGRPGLKEKVTAYRDKVIAAKAERAGKQR